MGGKELKHKLRWWGVVVLLMALAGGIVLSKFRTQEKNSFASGDYLLRLEGISATTNYSRDGTPRANTIGAALFVTDFTNWTLSYASGKDPLSEQTTFLDAGCYNVTRNALRDDGSCREDFASWNPGQQPGHITRNARLALTGAYLCDLLPTMRLDLAPFWIPVWSPLTSAHTVKMNATKTRVDFITSSNRLAAAEKEYLKRRPGIDIRFVTKDTPAHDFLRARVRVLKTTTFRGKTVPLQVELTTYCIPTTQRIGPFKVRSPVWGYVLQSAFSFQVTNVSVCEGKIAPPVLPKTIQFSSGGSYWVITNGLWPDFIAASNQLARPEPGPKPGYVPLALQLPPPPTQLVSWVPADTANTNIESFPPKRRPTFYVPPGVQNVALGKKVSSSAAGVPAATLERLVDGQNAALETNLLTLPGGVQWVQLDLGREYALHALVLWHDYRNLHVFHDVVVQGSDDPSFERNVRTLFNNDRDNSSGLGGGKDKEYYETYEGKLIQCDGLRARYFRFYSRGNSENDSNSYVEIEVYGLPGK